MATVGVKGLSYTFYVWSVTFERRLKTHLFTSSFTEILVPAVPHLLSFRIFVTALEEFLLDL